MALTLISLFYLLTDMCFIQQLELEVSAIHGQAYAAGTNKNLKTQFRAYLLFCTHAGIDPVPISPRHLSCYIMFLARSVQAYQTIKNYLNAVRLWHLSNNHAFHIMDSLDVRLTLRAVQKQLSTCPFQRLPITADILLKIYNIMDKSSTLHAVLWSAFLIAFFAFLRKSNVVPPTRASFDSTKHLTRGKIQIIDNVLIINITWSKTIQHFQKVLQIPLASIPGSPLCPVTAFKHMCTLIPASPNAPAFLVPFGNSHFTLTYESFVRNLRSFLDQAGYPSHLYSGHSFRRGGCSLASLSLVPPELIKIHGDWRSNAYLRYISLPLESKLLVTQFMARHISHTS